VLERADGRSGELVLRRRSGELEVIGNGSFLMAAANEPSSRALIAAARPSLPARPLEVLIGGLGMGYALDEALGLPDLREVVVAELEPVVVGWFARYMRERASRGSRDARSRILVADVYDVLVSGRRFDLVVLDTDNGPAWLVRQPNARLYDAAGVGVVRAALKPAGVAVFWSADEHLWFAERLGAEFGHVEPVAAHDVVDGRRVDCTMYVCR